jgi:hypothetical protein
MVVSHLTDPEVIGRPDLVVAIPSTGREMVRPGERPAAALAQGPSRPTGCQALAGVIGAEAASPPRETCRFGEPLNIFGIDFEQTKDVKTGHQGPHPVGLGAGVHRSTIGCAAQNEGVATAPCSKYPRLEEGQPRSESISG